MAGQLIARGDRTWLVRVFAGRVNGKRTYVNRTVNGTKKEAQSILTKLLHDRDTDRLAAPSRQTLAEYVDEWKEKALRGRVSPRTFRGYEHNLTQYIIPAIGSRRLTSITPWDVQGIYAAMLADGLAARTVRYAHAVLSNALGQAVKWRKLHSNPADHAELPKAQRIEQQALTVAQVGAFLRAVDGSAWRALYHLLLNTGLRPGEAFALTWANVDLAAGHLTVLQAVTYDANRKPVLREPKTTKSRRRVPFTQDLSRELLRHRDATLQIANPLHLVFPSVDGGLIHPNNWSKKDFKGALERAGLPKTVRLYDLRHYPACRVIPSWGWVVGVGSFRVRVGGCGLVGCAG